MNILFHSIISLCYCFKNASFSGENVHIVPLRLISKALFTAGMKMCSGRSDHKQMTETHSIQFKLFNILLENRLDDQLKPTNQLKLVLTVFSGQRASVSAMDSELCPTQWVCESGLGLCFLHFGAKPPKLRFQLAQFKSLLASALRQHIMFKNEVGRQRRGGI